MRRFFIFIIVIGIIAGAVFVACKRMPAKPKATVSKVTKTAKARPRKQKGVEVPPAQDQDRSQIRQAKEARAEAEKNLKEGRLLASRDAYLKVLELLPGSNLAAEARKSLSGLNTRLIFSKEITPESVIYEVKKGDTLSSIARKFGTTTELIARSNKLKSPVIYPGQDLKVVIAKFSILVDKSDNILILKQNSRFFKQYTVATGKDSSTPIGTFTINSKIIDPPWYKTGAVIPPGSPENILGSRWLGITAKGYGLHGTTEPESIGRQSTAGCVRMLNSDVEELFAIVPMGTAVEVHD